MIIRTSPKDFAAAVGSVMGVVPAKPTDPILAGIAITPADKGFTLSAYDYDSSAVVHVDGEIEDPQTVVVSGRGLANVTKVLPVRRPVEITLEGGGRKLVVASGATTFTLPTLDASQFPTLPNVDTVHGTVDTATLSTMARKVAHAANQDPASARLNAKGVVLIESKDDVLRLVAGTGQQLAIGVVPWEQRPDTSLTAQIPAGGLLDILAALPTVSEVEIRTNDTGSVVGFFADSGMVTTSTVDHNFPAAQIMRMFTGDGSRVTVDSDVVLDALRRTKAVMTKDASPFITLEFADGSGDITVEDTVHDEFDVEISGEPVEFGVNVGNLIETLSTFDDVVTLDFPDIRRVIISGADDAYRAIVAGGGVAK